MDYGEKLKDKVLGFFLTEKMSLRNWERTGIFFREIAPYNILARYFKKIYIFTYEDKGEFEYQKYLAPNIEIIYKRWRMRAKDYRWLLVFLNWRRVKECDFLKTNQLKARAALIAKILRPRSKLIVRTGYTQSLFEEKKNGRASRKIIGWEKIAYTLADKGLVTSKEDKQYLIRRYEIKQEKIEVIANYIDTDKFAPKEGEKHERRIVYSGKIEPQKNLENLVQALFGTDIALDIIGGAMDKASEALKIKLEKLAQELHVELTFSGRLPNDELPALLNKYQIYILPSLYEGMPKSLLEAMSVGLACIGTEVAGIKEIIKDGSNGILSGADHQNLHDNMLKLINDEELIKKFGDNARKFVVDNFSLKTQIKKEIEIYENIAQ